MTELQIFNHQDFGQIRVVEQDGEPWFVAADVCRALEVGNPSDAVARLDADDRTLVSIEGSSNGKPVNAVNEPGLYSLVLGSRKPEAKAFKRWITHEVLPSIRKTGGYHLVEVLPAVKQRSLTTDDYLKAATIVGSCRNERMPYVLGLLKQAGFSIPDVQRSREQLQTELMEVLDRAFSNGFTSRQISAMVGIDYGTICQYRRGIHKPGRKRAEYIIQVVRNAMEDTTE